MKFLAAGVTGDKGVVIPRREDGQISKRGAVMAHIARFARPGYVRIEATANPTSNVYVTANRGGNSTDVAVNKETSAVSQQFTLTNSTASWLTDVVPAAPSEATRELASR